MIARLLALAMPAAAIVAPPGWKLVGLDPHAKDTSIVDAATKTASVEQYMPAEDDPGITLFVTRASASELRGTRDAAIRALTDELRANAARGTEVTVSPVAAAGQLELTASWSDGSAHTRRTTRLVIAADAKRLVSVIGECIARDDIAAAKLEACKAALATLDADVPKADRVALILPAAEPPAPPIAPPTSAGPTLEPAHLDDGSRTPFPPIVVAPAPSPTDRRPVYVGAGVVLLALAFWWNRRQRDRFEREEGPTPPRRRRRRDPDADDLHAAARGDDEAKKAEDSDDR